MNFPLPAFLPGLLHANRVYTRSSTQNVQPFSHDAPAYMFNARNRWIREIRVLFGSLHVRVSVIWKLCEYENNGANNLVSESDANALTFSERLKKEKNTEKSIPYDVMKLYMESLSVSSWKMQVKRFFVDIESHWHKATQREREAERDTCIHPQKMILIVVV